MKSKEMSVIWKLIFSLQSLFSFEFWSVKPIVDYSPILLLGVILLLKGCQLKETYSHRTSELTLPYTEPFLHYALCLFPKLFPFRAVVSVFVYFSRFSYGVIVDR